MREISLLWFGYYFFFLQRGYSRGPYTDTSNDVVPRKDVPFEDLETKIEWLDPHFREKPPFLGSVLVGLRK